MMVYIKNDQYATMTLKKSLVSNIKFLGMHVVQWDFCKMIKSLLKQ